MTLLDNNARFRRRVTAYENLSIEEEETIRSLVHEEFQHFVKKPGRKFDPDSDVRYPTMKILHDKIKNCETLAFNWSLSTTRRVLVAMGFK